MGRSRRCVNILSEFKPADLAERLARWGYASSHAGRLLRAFYRSGEWSGADEAARLPIGLLERLHTELTLRATTLAARQNAADGTTKLLLRLADGHTVESVLMPDFRPDRAAGCLSSQVGCAMGCDFCATAQGGFERNLTSGEIVEQFLTLRSEAKAVGRELRTLVFMGMGEPLLNLEHLLPAIERIGDNSLGGFGWRQITVSTVGVVPGIDALTATGWNLHLAVSIHAPDDLTRSRLLPMGRRYEIEEILAAADRFQARQGRPVILQYCLLADVNDTPEQARQLADLVGRRRMHVNLLRYNPTGLGLRGTAYRTSSDETAARFAAVLKDRGVIAHFRRSRGPDIDAACGQLRHRISRTSRAPLTSGPTGAAV
ncbi:MAG: 23S rRNA (adenine(2503)-C(2))-methyltransferase RlmN [Verrucomicrobiales bacterium]|nr:23S rRNA (adenine(2503)-C(2))-methyltransferase RlmN [Verrucomicrobiales bacterium]